MKKIIYTVIFLIFTFVIFLFYFKKNNDHETFRCTAQVEQKSAIDSRQDAQIEMNTSVTVFFTHENSGFFSIVGTVDSEGVIYNLNRSVNFLASQKKINNLKKITITDEIKHPVDNTPKQMWDNKLAPQLAGVDFYAEIKKINDNTLIISSLSFPYLICVTQED